MWISRDNNKGDNYKTNDLVIFCSSEPKRNVYPELGCFYPLDFILAEIPINKFKKLFGFTPRKGSCEEIELDIKRKRIGRKEIRRAVKKHIMEKVKRGGIKKVDHRNPRKVK